MKLVAIGDIHGRNIWQQIVEQEQPTTVVFVGDYFDSYDIPGVDQIHNFKNIIQWKLDNPQCKVVLLVGNHDFHYMPICDEKYSGYQKALWPEIGEVLETNRHHLRIAYRCDDLVFSHAGITPEFLLNNNWDDRDMVEFLNDYGFINHINLNSLTTDMDIVTHMVMMNFKAHYGFDLKV